MLIETRLWVLISSKSRWKFLILRKKWLWAKCFSWTWKILLRISYILSVWISPLPLHPLVFFPSFSDTASLPALTALPCSHSQLYDLQELPWWAGLLKMLNCLGWSCGLTLSKAIWCWDKIGEKRHSQDLQDLRLTKAVSLMRKGEIKGVLAFLAKAPVEHRNAQRQKQLNLQ